MDDPPAALSSASEIAASSVVDAQEGKHDGRSNADAESTVGSRPAPTPALTTPPPPPTVAFPSSSDAFARHSTSSPHGRGSLSGWAPCPLCASLSSEAGSNNDSRKKRPRARSQKVYALGRGIATHLREVHRPWNPGKAERKRRISEWRRRKNMARKKKRACGRDGSPEEGRSGVDGTNVDGDDDVPPLVLKWDPTPKEVEEWERRVLELTAEVDARYAKASDSSRAATTNSNVDLSEEDNVESGNDGSSGPKSGGGSCGGANSIHDVVEPSSKRRRTTAGRAIEAGRDRNGNAAKTYRDSLPPLIKTAADGNAADVRRLAKEAHRLALAKNGGGKKDGEDPESAVDAAAKARADDAVLKLLDARDRNGSTAEHWAAGGGHLDCLRALQDLRRECHCNFSLPNNGGVQCADSRTSVTGSESKTKKVRRRDGKTALHYAARNGHVHVIDYLLSSSSSSSSDIDSEVANDDKGTRDSGDADGKDGSESGKILDRCLSSVASAADVISGDGTTPLHLACYTSSLPAVRRLIVRHRANPRLANEWGCDASHWSAMSVHPDPSAAVSTCEYLRSECGIEFHRAQKQGHTAAHKAAQRKNGDVLRWMVGKMTDEDRDVAGRPDAGGNRPSDIWRSVGGDEEFGDWLRDAAGW